MSSHDVRVFTQTVEGNQVRIKTPRIVTVRVASTANVADLAAASVSVDGVTCVAGDLVLLKNQSTASQNGIYAFGDVTSGVATLTRVWPMQSGEEGLNGSQIFVQSGTLSGGATFVLTNAGTITIGTTALTFARSSGVGAVGGIQTGTSAAMTTGAVTISTATITSASKIFVSRNTSGGTVGHLRVADADVTPGAPGSFVINSSSATETSTVNWMVVG